MPSLRVESLRVLEVCTTLLKACAAAGLTLAEIAGVVTRPLIGMEEEPSELERICFNARAEVEELSDEELLQDGVEEWEESEGKPGVKGAALFPGSGAGVRAQQHLAAQLLAPGTRGPPAAGPLSRCGAAPPCAGLPSLPCRPVLTQPDPPPCAPACCR